MPVRWFTHVLALLKLYTDLNLASILSLNNDAKDL